MYYSTGGSTVLSIWGHDLRTRMIWLFALHIYSSHAWRHSNQTASTLFYSMQHFILHTHCLTTKGLQMWSGRWDDCINTGCKTWAIRAQRRNTCLCSSNSSAPLSVIKELRASALVLWLQPRVESLRIKSNKMNQRTCPVTATCVRVLAAADGDSFAV